MESMRILLDEHQSLAAILHAVRLMIREIEAGKQAPDFELLHSMVRYLDIYAEQRHHPKEDRYIFRPLLERTQEGAEALRQLGRDHRDSTARIDVLAEALHAYAHNPAGGLPAFAQAFDDYATFYRDHMLPEENEILPLVRRHFTDEDWANANAGFRAERDTPNKAGTGTEHQDFLRWFSDLVDAAPAPLGFGSRKPQEG